METGRVEKGSESDQVFDDYHGSFSRTATWHQEYQIMPASQRPVDISKVRRYCTECGTRARKSSWKFCPTCGSRL